jgi:hypothetical protein
MPGFLAEKEALHRRPVNEVLDRKEYSFFEEKVSLLGIEGDNLILKISFLLE